VPVAGREFKETDATGGDGVDFVSGAVEVFVEVA
jgi:hypothetical protein